MQFKVFTVAAMLLFWTSTTLAKKCNNRGEKWKDLGSDAELDTAFGKICDHMAGNYEPNNTGSQVTFCQNVKKNRINVAISFYLVDGDQSDVTFDDNSD
ncbi:hypothetical protein Daus18300_008497 [Diaporthe australafricana]|uniref:Uncharacterized protein n=1 Tax=Diaporthe australafricana TaxID=127596 RepID=A0ABR3WI99_9PEZI